MKRKFTLGRESYVGVVPPPLSDIEIARSWRALGSTATPVVRRRATRPPLLLGVAAAIVAAVVAFVVVLLVSPGGDTAAASSAARGDVRAEDGRHQLELPDGSRVSLGAEALLRMHGFVADDIEWQLVRGMAEFTLASTGRRFVVSAGGFELLPRSGRFRVAVTGDEVDRRVEVTVYEGQLEIPQRRGDVPGQLTLSAGQTWSSDPAAAEVTPPAIE